MAVNVIQEWNKRLSLWTGLWIIDSHDSFIQKLKHCCAARRRTILLWLEMLLCSLQNWAKTDNIVFKIQHNINLLFTKLLYKITSKQAALVWYCSRCSCDIDDINMRQKHRGIFAPISWILGHNCIYGVVALHHICQQLIVWNARWCTGLRVGPVC